MEARLLAIAQGLAYAAVVFAFLYLAKRIADIRVRSQYDADREIDAGMNLAIALRRSGLYLGLAIGMLGALSGGGGGFTRDLIELAIEGAAVTVFLWIAQALSDVVVVHGISNDEGVREGNVAIGLVEFGSFVATGLIAFGAFAGEGGGIAGALAFFALGHIALLIMIRVYEQLTPFGVIEQIRGGNPAAGLMLGGMLVALGFILSASIAGPELGWAVDLQGFALSASMGIALLLLMQWPIDRLFLPATTLRQEIETDRNAAAIAVAVAVKIALALVISAVII